MVLSSKPVVGRASALITKSSGALDGRSPLGTAPCGRFAHAMPGLRRSTNWYQPERPMSLAERLPT